MEFDVIVAGAGISGGVPAACYLQKAGADVALIDRHHELAAYQRMPEAYPGIWKTAHASTFMGAPFPGWDDLELEKYGLDMRTGPIALGATGAEKNVALSFDPELTYKMMAKHSEKDAQKAKEFLSRALERFTEIQRIVNFTPPTADWYEDELLEIGGYLWDMDPEHLKTMNGWKLIETQFESEWVRKFFLILALKDFGGDIDMEGEGSTSIWGPLTWTTGGAVGGNHVQTHAMQRMFLDHGGTLLRGAMIDDIIIEDNRATGVHISEDSPAYNGKTIKANEAVICNLGVEQSFDLIGEDNIKEADGLAEYPSYTPNRLWHKFKNWRSFSWPPANSVIFLDGRINFSSTEWDEHVNLIDFGYSMPKSYDHYKQYWQDYKSHKMDPHFGEFIEICDTSFLTGGAAYNDDGIVAIKFDECAPFFQWEYEGEDPSYWDEKKEEYKKRREEAMNEVAPGFSDNVVDHVFNTPLDTARFNPAARYGHGLAGDQHGQVALDSMPYKAPIDGLYFSSAMGVWPLPASWAAPGYIVAEIVAEDLGIRDQPWWSSEPGEWMLNNMDRLTETFPAPDPFSR